VTKSVIGGMPRRFTYTYIKQNNGEQHAKIRLVFLSTGDIWHCHGICPSKERARDIPDPGDHPDGVPHRSRHGVFEEKKQEIKPGEGAFDWKAC
jgi:hypothetical protein